MIKRFLYRVKIQKEESCQLQEFSENALKGGQKPVPWFREPGADPGSGSGGRCFSLVPQGPARVAPDTLAKEKETEKVPGIVFQLRFPTRTLTWLFLYLCLLSLIMFCLGITE